MESSATIGSARFVDHNKNVIPFNTDLQPRLAHLRIEQMPPRAYVELPPVPRTGDHRTFQRPLPERPSLVRTHSIEGMNCAVHVEQRDNSSTSHHFLTRLRRHFPNGCYPDLTHCQPVVLSVHGALRGPL